MSATQAPARHYPQKQAPNRQSPLDKKGLNLLFVARNRPDQAIHPKPVKRLFHGSRFTGAVRIRDCANVATSFPGFVELANGCGFALGTAA